VNEGCCPASHTENRNTVKSLRIDVLADFECTRGRFVSNVAIGTLAMLLGRPEKNIRSVKSPVATIFKSSLNLGDLGEPGKVSTMSLSSVN